MNVFVRTLAAAGLVTATLSGVAQADVYSNFQVFNGTNPTPGNGGSAYEQATPGAGSIFAGTALYTGTYTGTVNFFEPSNANDTIAQYLATGSGSFSGPVTGLTQTLSSGGFATTTGLEFTFTAATSETVTITHDDGISLFQSGTDVFGGSAAAPTVAESSTASLIGGDTYTLYYIEANGAPAELNIAVPEPASIALLGAGLFGIGMIRRRKADRQA